MLTSAAVAGLLSHVKSDIQIPSKTELKKDKMASFSELLARPVKGDKAPMSELRFQQLQKSRSTDDFYRLGRRAVHLLDGKVNIPSLANDIIHWFQEFNNQVDREPAKRLAVRWATDYFTVLPNKTK